MKPGSDYPSSEKTYRIIIDNLRQAIEDGQYKPGAKLPSEKELCNYFGASRSSVREALRALEYIGLIEVQSGSGYYVTGNALPFADELNDRCATKIAVTLNPAWTIRSIRQQLEQGADGAIIAVEGEDNGVWQKQLRAVRQAARDINMAVPVIADITAGNDEQTAIPLLESAVQARVDAISVGAVHDESRILAARQIIDSSDYGNIPVFAKLESYNERMQHIVMAADGLILSPQFLEEVSHDVLQDIIGQCHFHGKLMLLVWREELTVASDQAKQIISRAVAYGFDGIILQTGGSAQKFPQSVLAKFKHLIKQTEEHAIGHPEQRIGRVIASPVADALCQAAIHAARAMRASAFVVPTTSGFTPRLLAKFRQELPIIAVTANDNAARQLRLVRGVQPLLARRAFHQEDNFELAVNAALTRELLHEGDAVVAVCSNLDVANCHSTIQLLVVGDIILKGQGIGHGIVTGRVALVKGLYDINKRVKDKILVMQATAAGHIRMIEEAAGLIVEEGGLSSHAAITCLSLGKPVIVGAADATNVLIEDEQITMDVMRGIVYQGWVNLG